MSPPDLIVYYKQICDQKIASDSLCAGLGVVELFALWNCLVETSSFPRILAIEEEIPVKVKSSSLSSTA